MKTINVLIRAKNLIRKKKNHTIGCRYEKRSGTDRYCGVGAIRKVVGDPLDIGSPSSEATNMARAQLSASCHELFGNGIFDANDRLGFRAVHQAFKHAIDRLRKGGK